MILHCIFVLEASLGVDLDLSTLYHGSIMFLGAFSGYYLNEGKHLVSSYK
jgi:hypothetical protein